MDGLLPSSVREHSEMLAFQDMFLPPDSSRREQAGDWLLVNASFFVLACFLHSVAFRVAKFVAWTAAETGKVVVHLRWYIEQILKEAQHRWLRPTEICEILENYRNFHIAPEPPNKPPSGSLFLFDRKVLRYFRKDGHNWRKKRDGKTVKEAHERLKSGSIDVLHCYYAHGEENANFQRRSYWMLEEDYVHIVLVHYLEIKAGKLSSRGRGHADILQTSRADSPLSQLPSQTKESESSVSGQASEYDKTESADIYSGGARYHSFSQMQQHENGGGSVIDASMFSYYVPALSVGSSEVMKDYRLQHLIQASILMVKISEGTDNIIEASTSDQFTLGLVLSQDQLFSIVDFSPTWTYAGFQRLRFLLMVDS
ncbi:hypothetical protein GUJ93_ZPchr0013g34935 [Zizania palustris]|uniref:CG-1 domain-containing protein n=1 Tax=Zizania palustris TaxID=103762 RepID=A0A8J6BW28_ZIZPA|nr:hypothetical protein GUJ93_ZPchr0013g34935 [Zizania palustris]